MAAPVFRLYLWPQRLLFLGSAFDTEWHRHHAAQLCVGLSGPLRMRAAVDDDWQQAPAFYVPPDVPHVFDAAGSACALLYLDPEGGECEWACRRFGHDGLRALEMAPAGVDKLLHLRERGGDAGDAAQACCALLGSERTPPLRAVDPRLIRALEWVHAHIDEAISLAEVARVAAVSESWLSHRFSAELGVPLRRYLLWRRLRRAVEVALDGATLTEAAHAAGLSDSAHLTRSFRDMFGVAPSLLFAQRGQLDVVICD